MRVKFTRTAANGTVRARSEAEIAETRQRVDAYSFVAAHPDLALVFTEDTQACVRHVVHGNYLTSSAIEHVLDRFSIPAYLEWVAWKQRRPVAGGNQ